MIFHFSVSVVVFEYGSVMIIDHLKSSIQIFAIPPVRTKSLTPSQLITEKRLSQYFITLIVSLDVTLLLF